MEKTSAQVICDSVLSAAASLDKVDSFIGLLLYFPVANLFVSVVLVSISCESAVLRDCNCVKQEPSQRHGRWAPCFFRWVRWSKKQSYDSIGLNIFSFVYYIPYVPATSEMSRSVPPTTGTRHDDNERAA